jgi:hypothetical protein
VVRLVFKRAATYFLSAFVLVHDVHLLLVHNVHLLCVHIVHLLIVHIVHLLVAATYLLYVESN